MVTPRSVVSHAARTALVGAGAIVGLVACSSSSLPPAGDGPQPPTAPASVAPGTPTVASTIRPIPTGTLPPIAPAFSGTARPRPTAETLSAACRAAWTEARERYNDSVDRAIRACRSLAEYLAGARWSGVVVNRFLTTRELVDARCRAGPIALEATAVCRAVLGR